ncbi:MAG: hypothetical protein ACD_54C00281G0001 [uncultured bacterium]|nr:MAG: hypothetical protein ACD_54C00281G0001 [uncultured bacterium]
MAWLFRCWAVTVRPSRAVSGPTVSNSSPSACAALSRAHIAAISAGKSVIYAFNNSCTIGMTFSP